MEISLILLREIAQLFLMMLMGYLVVRTDLLRPSDSRSISVIMVFLVTPCMIINAFQVEYTLQVQQGLLFAFALAIGAHVLFLLFAALLRRVLKLDVVEQGVVVYTNAGILVVPLVQALLGENYVIYSCAFLVVQQVLLWTHCRCMLCGERRIDWKKLVFNINILAIVVGGILFLLHITLPQVLGETVATIGSMMGPLGMILAGMVIAEMPLGKLFREKRHYLAVVLRLVICPLLALAVLRVLGVAGWMADGKNIVLTVYLACITPACATVTSMAQLYEKNAAYSSALYVLSTLLSILTMPVMVGLFDRLI